MARFERLTITLPADLVAAVEGAVGADGYASTSDVIREAVRDWQMKSEKRRRRLEALRRDVDVGVRDVAAGRVVDFDVDAIVAEGRRRSRRRKRPA